VFHGLIPNIQTSWVKMGEKGVIACLQAGANDLGGTLMNESITRAAGANYGQEWPPAMIEQTIRSISRTPRMRTTLYQDAPDPRRKLAFNAVKLKEIENNSAGKLQRSKRLGNLAQVS
jgi:FO synthase